MRARLLGQAGMSLVEVMVAVGLLAVGLIAFLQSAPVGLAGTETGRQQSTAVFLGRQKMEGIRAWSLSSSAAPVQQGFDTLLSAGTCFTPVTGACATDAYGAISGYPTYRRVVTVSPDPGTPVPPNHTRTVVTVRIFYRPVTGQGIAGVEREVDLSTMLARH